VSVTSSGGSAILVDEATVAIAAFDVCRGIAGEWDRVDRAMPSLAGRASGTRRQGSRSVLSGLVFGPKPA
jgi:hypothetical protein